MATEVGAGGNPLKFTTIIDFSQADKELDSFYKRMADKASKGLEGNTSKSFSGMVKKQEDQLLNQQKVIQSMTAQYRRLMSEAISSFNSQDTATKNLYNTLTSLQQQLRNINGAQKDLANSFKFGTITQRQYIDGSRALSIQQNAVKQRISETNAAIRQQDTAEKQTIGSIAEKTAKLTQLRKEYNALSEAQRNNINVGGKISAQFQAISSEVTQLNSQLTGTRSGQAGIGALFGKIQSIAGVLGIAFGVQQLVSFGQELFQIAKQADGVNRAFNRLEGDATLNLQKLRTATKGTVNDLELMKLAVKAENFKIPLDVLSKGLMFARQRANDTGQSVDYLVNSFVDGIGRQSKLVLDNLGISANDLSKEIEKTGDFAKAAGNIIDREFSKAGDAVDTLADRVDRVNTKWENLKLSTANYFKALMYDLTSLITSDSWKEFTMSIGSVIGRLSNMGGNSDISSTVINAGLDPREKTKNLSKKDADEAVKIRKVLYDFNRLDKKAQEEALKKQLEILDSRRKEILLNKENKKLQEDIVFQSKLYAKYAESYQKKHGNAAVKDQVGLVEQLKNDIEDLQKLRDKATEKSKISSYNKQIDSKQKQLDALLGKNSSSKKEKQDDQKDKKEFQSLIEDAKKLASQYTNEVVSKDQAEINKVIDSYDQLIKKASEYNKTTKGEKIDIKNLETEKGLSINRVIELQEKQETQRQKEENDKKIKEAEKAYEELLKKYESYEQKRERIIEEANKEIAKLESKGEKDRARVVERTKQEAIKELYKTEIESSQAYKSVQESIDNASPILMAKTLKLGADTMRSYIKGMKLSPQMAKELEKQFVKPLEKAGNEAYSGNYKEIENLVTGFDQLVNMAIQFDDNLGNALKSIGSMVSQVGDLTKTLSSVGSGMSKAGGILGIAGAIIGIIGSVTEAVSNARFAKRQQYQEQQDYSNDYQLRQVEAITQALERQLALIQEIYGTDRVTEFSRIVKESTEAFNDSVKSFNGVLAPSYTSGVKDKNLQNIMSGKGGLVKFQLTGDKKYDDFIRKLNEGADFEKAFGKKGSKAYDIAAAVLKGMINDGMLKPVELGFTNLENITIAQIEDLQRLIDEGKLDDISKRQAESIINNYKVFKDAMNQLREELTGVSFNSLTSGIVSMFEQGKTSVKDFTDFFEKQMQQAVLKGFSRKMIETQMQGWYEEFYKASESNGGLDADEITKLRESYFDIMEKANKEFEELKKLDIGLGGDSEGNQGELSKGIQGITENTANRLEAEFGGLRLAQLALLETTKSNHMQYVQLASERLSELVAIQNNTLRTANNTEHLSRLSNIETAIVQLNSKITNTDAIRRGAGL